MGEVDNSGCAWQISVNDSIQGFVSVEDNKEDLDFATVTISIILGEITNFSRDNLLNLLEINSNLFRAKLNVLRLTNDKRLHELLLIEYKSKPDVFNPEDSNDTIEYLLEQAELFIPDDVFETDDDSIDIDELTKQAESGNAEAMYLLGSLNLTGHNVPYDKDECIRWLKASISQGHNGAMKFLDQEVALL